MKKTTSKEIEKVQLIARKGDQEIDLGLSKIEPDRVRYHKNFSMIWTDKYQRTGDLMLDLFMWMIANAKRGWIDRVKDEDIAKEFGVTRKTISTAKKKMKKAGLIKYEAKAIFLNPEIVWRGTNPTQREDCKAEFEKYKGIGDEKRSTNGTESTLAIMEPSKEPEKKIQDNI